MEKVFSLLPFLTSSFYDRMQNMNKFYRVGPEIGFPDLPCGMMKIYRLLFNLGSGTLPGLGFRKGYIPDHPVEATAKITSWRPLDMHL